MKHHMKKIASLSLVFLLSVSLLAGCGKKDGKGNGGGKGNASDFVYVAEYQPLSANMSYSGDSMSFYDDSLYYINETYDESLLPKDDMLRYPESDVDAEATDDGDMEAWEKAYEAYENSREVTLCKLDINTGNVETLPNYVPYEVADGENKQRSYTSGLTADAQGNLYLMENYDEEDPNSEYGYTSNNILRKLDNTGKEISQVSLNGYLKESEYSPYIRQLVVDAAGNIYFADEENVYVLNAACEFQFSVSVSNWIDSLVLTGDGKVLCSVYEETPVLKAVDLAKQAWGESYKISYNISRLYTGDETYPLYYSDDSNFYGFDPQKNEATKLLNWISCDLDSNTLSGVMPLPNGDIVAINRPNSYMDISSDGDSEETPGPELVRLKKRPASEVKQKEVITMAALYSPWELRPEIIKFNKTNENYRIELNDYSEFDNDEDWNAGLKKLNTEILSGNVPDVLYTANLPVDLYIQKGILEDLLPYLDQDKTLSQASLVPQILSKALKDGKLYEAFSKAQISTVAGSKEVVGDRVGWTMEEMNEALKKLPEGATPFANMTQTQWLYMNLQYNMGQYVDMATGECKLDGPEFIQLLEMSKSYPKEYDWEKMQEIDPDFWNESLKIKNGQAMLMNYYISSFDDIPYVRAELGTDVSFVGFPSQEGSGGMISFEDGLAITSKCKNKEGAWEFVRTVFTEEYQKKSYWGFPSNQTVMDQKIYNALHPEEAQQNGGVMISKAVPMGGENNDPDPVTQADIDLVLNLFSQLDRRQNYDDKIYEIVVEEAEAFFADQKSAADTAAVIQSRVKVYINEQR